MSMSTEGVHSRSGAVTQYEQDRYSDRKTLEQISEIGDETWRAQQLVEFFRAKAGNIDRKISPGSTRPVLDLNTIVKA